MTYRIAWLSPLTPTSGVGTFSHAIVRSFPKSFNGEAIDLTILYVGHRKLYQNEHRSIQIGEGEDFHNILSLFDLLVYNIGNNREHHEAIFSLLRLHPGVIVCHDYVYQHYLADRSLRSGRSFAPFAALLLKYGDESAADYLQRSRITSRTGRIRYSPWDSDASVAQPMSDAVLALGSALVVHSTFAERHVETRFTGPVLKLGMPHDQKPAARPVDLAVWERSVAAKPFFNLVSFGHIQSTKCIDQLLAALGSSDMLRKRVRYTIAGFVGDPGYYDRLKAMVTALSLQSIVSFELDVSESRLDELMQQADMFSNLRRPNTEGSSVSLIEQLEAGKPVIVLDSGCYAEVPTDAAVKLPSDGTSDDIRDALEALISRPAAMPGIGRAGRAFARSWSCTTYAQHFMRFAFEHRPLLERRAKAIALQSKALPCAVEADAWILGLARARASLIYLDRNMLAVDPYIILRKSTDQLCTYVAHVIFGIFGNARLQRALSCFFARLDRRQAYWACVRFALIIEAVFGEDETARDRLVNLKPCYDPEFWAVLEALPAHKYIATVTLVLMRRHPKPEELSIIGLDDHDGFPKRLRMIEIVRHLNPSRDPALERLSKWLESSCSPALDRDLPEIDRDFECDVGSQTFKEKANLSGFYAMEADHAWTRGHQGFLGMRLGTDAAQVEVLIHPIDASPDRPCTISLAYDDEVREMVVEDCVPRWLTLELSHPSGMDSRTHWLKFATDYATTPENSNDTRLLGVCFLRLRVRLSEAIGVTRESPLAVLNMHEGAARLAHHGATGTRPTRRRKAGFDR